MRHMDGLRFESRRACGLGARARAIRQRFRERHVSRRGAGNLHARGQRIGHECRKRRIPYRFRAEMAGQMQRRIPAAGDREQIRIDAMTMSGGVQHGDALQA